MSQWISPALSQAYWRARATASATVSTSASGRVFFRLSHSPTL